MTTLSLSEQASLQEWKRMTTPSLSEQASLLINNAVHIGNLLLSFRRYLLPAVVEKKTAVRYSCIV
jgi:hypothetical protein